MANFVEYILLQFKKINNNNQFDGYGVSVMQEGDALEVAQHRARG